MQLDLILEDADVLTMDPRRPRASRVGIWRGVVVGVDEELDGLAAAERADMHGAFVMPGFNDAHAHSVWFGQSRLDVDLEGATTATEVYARIGARAAPPACWTRPPCTSSPGSCSRSPSSTSGPASSVRPPSTRPRASPP